MISTIIQQQLLPSKHPQFINQALLKYIVFGTFRSLELFHITYYDQSGIVCKDFKGICTAPCPSSTNIAGKMCYTIWYKTLILFFAKEAEWIAQKQ